MSDGALGILGGTFDPVHHGHLRSAVEVREQLGLSEVRLVPAARPPHRDEPSASAAHRLAMLELALSGTSGLRTDDRELRREGPSWMVDTLASFRAEAPGRPLFLIHLWGKIFWVKVQPFKKLGVELCLYSPNGKILSVLGFVSLVKLL